MARRRPSNEVAQGNGEVLARFYADIHLHEWQDFAEVEPPDSQFAGMNTRLADQLRTLLSAPPPENRYIPAVICGDITHKRGYVTPAVGWAVSYWLMHLRQHHDQVIIFPGNHDYPLKAGAGWIHSLSPFIPLGVGGIEVADTTAFHITAGDAVLCTVPWMPDIEDWRNAIDMAAQEVVSRGDSVKILATHIAVQGGAMANGHAYTGRGATLEDLHPEVFDQVLLGDFHKRQRLMPNVHYIGAPMQHHWGDAQDNAKGYAEVLLQTDGSTTVRFTELASPKFVEARNMVDATVERANGNYVRVASDDSQILTTASEAGMATVREIPPPPDSRIQLRPGSRPKDVLVAYFDQGHYQGDLDSEELEKLGMSILDDTSSAEEQQRGAMQIISIEAANFLSYPRLSVQLDQRGVVLLDGANEDDPDADSNGAGKSALIECVTAALYGQTLRSIPVSEWVKKGSRHGWVRATVATPRGTLVITRNRGYENLPAGLSVTLNGERIDSTARDFQSQLDDILGMDFKTFTQIAVFGQEVPRVFAEESDAVRKELLETLCGGEQFEAPHLHVKELKDSIARQSAEASTKLLNLNHSIASLEAEVTHLTDKSISWASDREARRVTAAAEHANALSALEQAENEVAVTRQTLEDTPCVEVQNTEREHREALVAATAAETKVATITAEIDGLNRKLEELDRETFSITGGSASCPACDRPYETQESAARRIAILAHTLEATQVDIRRCKAELAQASEEAAAARAAVLRVAQAANENQLQRHNRYTAQAAFDAATRNLEAQGRVLNAANSRVRDIDNEVNHFEPLLETKTQALATAKEDHARVTAEKQGADSVLPYLEECVRLFGNQGLKTFLFDSLAPQITNEANRALSILSSGNISVKVSTERRGRSEKIVLEVENEKGAPSFGGNSGGQKRKVNLALCWAIASLAEGRVNLLFIDEAFDSLDSTAGIRVCDLLEARSADTGTIIVTTHRTEFRDAFPTVWTARRRNGDSVLEIP